jgi:hypothetical protein
MRELPHLSQTCSSKFGPRHLALDLPSLLFGFTSRTRRIVQAASPNTAVVPRLIVCGKQSSRVPVIWVEGFFWVFWHTQQ